MALQQTHVIFLKEVIKEYSSLKKYNNKNLYYGGIYPDLFYVSLFFPKPNFSIYLHSRKDVIDIGKQMLVNSKNISEKSFSLGFISHFFLDKRIHGYLEKEGYFKGSEHLSLEFYLHIFLKSKDKVLVSKTPKKILIKTFKESIKGFSKKRYEYISNFLLNTLFLFVCNYILKETIEVKYLKNKKSNFFKDLFLKLSYFLAFRHYGYSVKDVLNPNFKLLDKHVPFLLKEYSLAKKDFIKFLDENSDLYG